MKFKIKVPTNGRGGVPLPKADAKAVTKLAGSVAKFLERHRERVESRVAQQTGMTRMGGMRNAQGTGRAAAESGE